jgi:hypothetical protein
MHTLSPPTKYIHKLRGLSPIHSKHWHGAQGLMWGTRGPFPLAAAMGVVVVMPVVFGAKAAEKCNKNTKISFLVSIVLFVTIYCKTYCSSRIANCSMAQAQVVACPEPEPLWSNEPLAYWVSPESSCHCKNDSQIVLRRKHRSNEENENWLYTTYLRLLILGAWLFREWFLCPGGSYAPCSTVLDF